MAKKNKKSKDGDKSLSNDDLGINPLNPGIPQPQQQEVQQSSPSEQVQASIPSPSGITEVPANVELDFVQSETNVGMVGHVDHGKTTLVKALSGQWTERYADEINRGITIKLGYAEAEMGTCPKCNKTYTLNLANNLRQSKKQEKGTCPVDGEKLKFRRRVSFVDAPGHEILMATMLSGASLMDGALLLISATESCPQPQTKEHLAALEIAKIENIIIVQNKIDAVGKQKAFEHYQQIKKFIKGSIAEKAPIIPVSAIFNANVDLVCEKIEEIIPTPNLDENADFLFNVARSFDVNKPGSEIDDLKGGVVGGSIVSGKISIGDQVEIRPGLKTKEGKYRPIITTIHSIYEGNHSLKSARPGGLIALGTELDPSMTRTDQLIGNALGKPSSLPDALSNINLEVHLLEKVLGAEEDMSVDPLKKGEVLMIVVGTMTSAGSLDQFMKGNIISLSLKRPICALKGSITAISRKINGRFRLIGYGYLV